MSRRLVGLTLDNLDDLPAQCRGCVFWELGPAGTESSELEKEAWLSDTLLQWGSCGQLVEVDGVVAGYVLFAPPAYVPRAGAFPTSPVSPDAVLLMTSWIAPEYRNGGLGRVLAQGVARDIVRRGLRAVEAFGRADPGSAKAPAGSGCLLPADYLLAVGFKTVRAHPHTPRLRLDVRSTATWKEDVEYAFDRLLGSIQTPALSR